jgi:hypothetical protein
MRFGTESNLPRVELWLTIASAGDHAESQVSTIKELLHVIQLHELQPMKLSIYAVYFIRITEEWVFQAKWGTFDGPTRHEEVVMKVYSVRDESWFLYTNEPQYFWLPPGREVLIVVIWAAGKPRMSRSRMLISQTIARDNRNRWVQYKNEGWLSRNEIGISTIFSQKWKLVLYQEAMRPCQLNAEKEIYRRNNDRQHEYELLPSDRRFLSD